jgi:hypothetical protein
MMASIKLPWRVTVRNKAKVVLFTLVLLLAGCGGEAPKTIAIWGVPQQAAEIQFKYYEGVSTGYSSRYEFLVNGCRVAFVTTNVQKTQELRGIILEAAANNKKIAFFGELREGFRKTPRLINLLAVGNEWGQCILRLQDGKPNFGDPPG